MAGISAVRSPDLVFLFRFPIPRWREGGEIFHFKFSQVNILCHIIIVIVLLSAIGPAAADEEAKPEDWERRLEMLRSVPYLAFSRSEAGEVDSSVAVYLPELAWDGYNFFNSLTFGSARLFDMRGREVHRWRLPPAGEDEPGGTDFAFLLNDGDLMIIRKESRLMRIDRGSELLWQRDLPVHHDVARAPDGTFYALYRELKMYRGLRVHFCGIIHLDADGEEIGRWSTFEHLEDISAALDTRSFMDTILDSVVQGWSPQGHELDAVRTAEKPGGQPYDYFHMNTVSVLPANTLEREDERFRAGNLLVCFRNVNQIAVLEKDTYRVLWAWGEGRLQWPHYPTLLENGHLLIFDNGVRRRYSRVVEVDPLTGAIVWSYQGTPRESFFSFGKGSAQRLPNGNTLICNSDQGQVFEVTAEGRTVWLWWNPFVRNGRREALYRMIRWSGEALESWLPNSESGKTMEPPRKGDRSGGP